MGVTALILAGGLGSRMGGADKGWIEFDGTPLVERLLAQLSAQADHIIISANRNLDRYAALPASVVSDLRPDYAGPLAGIEAALSACETEWLLTSPVDTLKLPPDYAQRMLEAGPSVVVQGGRLQPVFMLIPRSALHALQRFLDAGERKVGLWVEQQGLSRVSFDDAPGAFTNLNDWQAMQQAQQ
ncbi:molybdenum cofactor guanylyltransferase MobA [Uliginosibacterium sp. H3]|uniref:Molybdenum cofactor guanylyltransferase n=1 Tax=Uliginosibacterium silvisoli TaxID=3114758 RepID=A0ABU6K3P2_9RHOO|nr:molybdenum cofactor guanylyltransferase MobA [Uliginosibacterium sp. H3]